MAYGDAAMIQWRKVQSSPQDGMMVLYSAGAF